MRAPCSAATGPLLALLLLLATAAATPAGAVSETSPLTIPPAQFVDAYPHEGNGLLRSPVQGSLSQDGTGTLNGELGVAGVHLPDGARVTALVGGILDPDAEDVVILSLYRRRIGANAVAILQEVARIDTTGASAEVRMFRDETIEFASIDNSLYVYWVSAYIEGGNQLFSAQIEFDWAIFIDGFESGDTSAWSSTTP